MSWTATTGAGASDHPIILSTCQPLFTGYQRLIFQHPAQEGLLIKVLRKDYVTAKFGPRASFHNRHRRCLQYHLFLKELREYLVVCVRSPECLPYLQTLVGLVHTDLGLGLVVGKIQGQDGCPGPKLSQVLRLGTLDAGRRQRLEHCLEALLNSEVVVDDLNLGNFVLGTDAAGEERFVLIDGMGGSTLIPLKGMLRLANRWSKRRRFERLRAEIAI